MGVQRVRTPNLTRMEDSFTSDTKAAISGSMASSLISPPSTDGLEVPTRRASRQASRIGFLMSFIAPQIREGYASFPSFACDVVSRVERSFPSARAATGLRFICVSLSRSRIARVRSASPFSCGPVSIRPLQLDSALSTSSKASFRCFHAVFPCFEP